MAIRSKAFETGPIPLDVEFRAEHGEGTSGEGFVIGGQFVAHHLEARHRIFGNPLGDIDDMRQEAGSFDVAKELKTQPLALVRYMGQQVELLRKAPCETNS